MKKLKRIYSSKLCECGCGKKVKFYKGRLNRYVRYHHKRKGGERQGRWFKGKRKRRRSPILCKCGCFSEVTVRWNHYSRIISQFINGHQGRGRPGWNKGLTKYDHPGIAKQARKISGRTQTEEHKQKKGFKKGHIASTKTREKQSIAAKKRCESKRYKKEFIKRTTKANFERSYCRLKYNRIWNPFTKLCDHGCGEKAKYYYRSTNLSVVGRWRCSRNANECPTLQQRKKKIIQAIWQDPKYRKKHRRAMKKLWQDPSYWIMMGKARNMKPNKAELYLNKILNKLFPNEYKYVGDFSEWVGGKNPDFISTNGHKKVIELFGDYWHGEEKTGFPQRGEGGRRKRHFAKHGYDCLIVWEKELRENPDALIDKLLTFNLSS